LAADENLDDDDRRSAVTAPWFHDIGFVERYEDNEEMAAALTEEELVRVGVDAGAIALVTGAILATRLPQRPVGIVAEIVCDADLFVLGTERFFERDARLREELAASGTTSADAERDERQLSFIERHRYFTEAARRRNDPTKAANARELRRRAMGRR
jgi:predicted metal-dependent HD superfamily phosphohydrolase